MKTLALDSDTSQEKFGEFVRELAPGEVRVVDADGHVLAYVTRLPDSGEGLYNELSKLAARDESELRRRQRDGTTGRTTAEVIQELIAKNSAPS